MGDYDIQEQSGKWVVTWRRSNFYAVPFMLLWLSAWTYGFIEIGTTPWEVGMWNVMVLLGLVEIWALGLTLYLLAGRDRLIVSQHKVKFARSAIIVFDSCTIAMQDIRSVDLLPPKPTEKNDSAAGTLIIASDDREIRFGKGLNGKELHELLPRLRQRLSEHSAELEPVVKANEVAPLSEAEQQEYNANKPQSISTQIGHWLAMPIFIFVGCLFVYGGMGAITSGHPLPIIFGLYFLSLGLILSVGLTWFTIACFLNWLLQRKNSVADTVIDSCDRELNIPKTVHAAAEASDSTPFQNDSVVSESHINERQEDTWLFTIEAIAFALLAVFMLIWRFLTIPWDFAGVFFQVLISVAGVSVLGTWLPELKLAPRIVATGILLPVLSIMVWGTLRFYPVILIPFGLLGAATGGICETWSRSRFRLATILALALLPIFADIGFYAIPRIQILHHFRNMPPQEIQDIQIDDLDHVPIAIINDRPAIERIARSLAYTSPYSPNRESISQPRQMTIRVTDGSHITVKIGKGNQAHPDTVWVEFDGEVYQNPSLYKVLKAHEVFEITTASEQ